MHLWKQQRKWLNVFVASEQLHWKEQIIRIILKKNLFGKNDVFTCLACTNKKNILQETLRIRTKENSLDDILNNFKAFDYIWQMKKHWNANKADLYCKTCSDVQHGIVFIRKCQRDDVFFSGSKISVTEDFNSAWTCNCLCHPSNKAH